MRPAHGQTGRMKIHHVVSILCLCAALAGCGRPPEPPRPVLDEHGVYVHPPSAMAFPPAVGAFERRNIYPRSDAEVDVSYGWLSPVGPILITMTLTPAPARDDACRAEFDNRKREIVATNASGRWLADGNASLPAGGANYGGWTASFDTELNGAPVRGYVYVFCVGKDWLLAYRVTGPRGEEAARIITDFIAKLPGAPLQQRR